MQTGPFQSVILYIIGKSITNVLTSKYNINVETGQDLANFI